MKIKTFIKRYCAMLLSLALLLPQMISYCQTGDALEWEDGTVTVYSAAGYAYYPRAIKLADGTVLCGFASGDHSPQSAIHIVRSTDNGATWSKAPVVASQCPQHSCDNANFLQLDNGDVLLSYRAVSRAASGETYTSLRTAISRDGGYTWEAHSLIAEYNNPGFNGVWEPHLGYIGGTLAVFYANDSLVDNGGVEPHQQNIEYRLYENGEWSERRIVSSGVKTNSRDGMPVWCRLSDGSYALAVEGTRSAGLIRKRDSIFIIKLMLSRDGLNWSEDDAVDIYYPGKSKRSAAAPYIVCLPDGRIAVSFQTDEDYTTAGSLFEGKGYTMKVMVSKYPVTASSRIIPFHEPETPFEVSEERCAIWNGMHLIDDTLTAYSSTNSDGWKIVLRRADITALSERYGVRKAPGTL